MYIPDPTAIPMAAVAQMVAAVVRPETVTPLRKIVPAPKNPTPVTIWAATLDWSADSKPNAEIIVNSAEPHGHQRQRPQPRRFISAAALVSHGGPEDSSQQQPDRNLNLLTGGECEDIFQGSFP